MYFQEAQIGENITIAGSSTCTFITLWISQLCHRMVVFIFTLFARHIHMRPCAPMCGTESPHCPEQLYSVRENGLVLFLNARPAGAGGCKSALAASSWWGCLSSRAKWPAYSSLCRLFLAPKIVVCYTWLLRRLCQGFTRKLIGVNSFQFFLYYIRIADIDVITLNTITALSEQVWLF